MSVIPQVENIKKRCSEMCGKIKNRKSISIPQI